MLLEITKITYGKDADGETHRLETCVMTEASDYRFMTIEELKNFAESVKVVSAITEDDGDVIGYLDPIAEETITVRVFEDMDSVCRETISWRVFGEDGGE